MTRIARKAPKGPVSLYDKLRTLEVNKRHPLEAEGWDSLFYQKPNHDAFFRYQDRIARGSEVNYFAMGMLMKHSGKELHEAITIVNRWKAANIVGESAAELITLSLYKSKYEMPTDNEIFFLALGYHSYDKPNE